MEFEVKTDLAIMQPQKIESNVAEVKTWLLSVLEPYKNLVVTEDAVAEAKQNRANINKLKKAIDEKRKLTKKMWVSPYVKWETEVNELLALCDEASANIDTQVKNFENASKEQKKAELEKFFNENAVAADVDFYVTFEQVFSPKWLNATVKVETAMQEIKNIIQETVDDLKVIGDLESEYAEELYLDYKQNHDIKRVISRNKALSEMKTATNVRKQRTDDWKVSDGIKPPWEEETPQTEKNADKLQQEKSYDLLLQLRLTEKQARNLKKFMAAEGIEVVQSKMKENKQ